CSARPGNTPGKTPLPARAAFPSRRRDGAGCGRARSDTTSAASTAPAPGTTCGPRPPAAPTAVRERRRTCGAGAPGRRRLPAACPGGDVVAFGRGSGVEEERVVDYAPRVRE